LLASLLPTIPLALLLCGLAFLFPQVLRLPHPSYVLLLALALPLDGLFAVGQGALQGHELLVPASRIQLSWTAVRFGFTWLAVSGLHSLAGVIGALPVARIALLVPTLALAFRAGRHMGSGQAGPRKTTTQTRDSSNSFLFTFLAVATLQIASSLPVIVARIRLTPLESGIYSAAATLGNLALVLAAVSTTIAFPQVVRRWATNEDSSQLLSWITIGLLTIGASVALLGHLASPHIIRLLFADRYLPAANLLGGYLLATTLQGLGLLWTYVHIAIQSRCFLFTFFGLTMIGAAALMVFPPQPTLFITIIGAHGLLAGMSGAWLYHRAVASRNCRKSRPACCPPGYQLISSECSKDLCAF
jgi:O-antigen/teichoic acid export membrane protein